jgi:serine/threonine protein kinase
MADADKLHEKHWRGIKPNSKHWYNIVDRIDVGDTSVTYLVVKSTHEGDRESLAVGAGNTYALKMAHKRDRETIERFRSERGFLITNEHPSILSCPDIGDWYGHPFYVSGYHPRTLNDAIGSSMSNGRKVSFATQLVSALVELNKAGVVHRDIKPGNIFLIGNNTVLGDFGLMIYEDRDIENKFAFTKNYPAPEFADNTDVGEITSKANVFQLGLVLAELFTGENPANSTDLDGNDDDEDPDIIYNPTDNIKNIQCYEQERVSEMIEDMITENVSDRPSAKEIMATWGGILKEESKRSSIR